MRELGSWYVEYADHTSLWQYDEQHPQFLADGQGGGEVPYRAIDWSKVERVPFESQWTEPTVYEVAHVDGYSVSLKSRHFRSPEGTTTMCYMLVTTDDAIPIDPDRIATQKAATLMMNFWFPNGVTHSCPDYDCPDVSRYGLALVHGQPGQLMPESHVTTLHVDAHAA